MQFLNSVYSAVKHSRPLIHNYRVGVSNDVPFNILTQSFRAFSSRLDSDQETILSSIPHRPKKPPSVYLRFIKIVEPKLIQKLPNAKRTEIIKTASEMYKEIDKETLLDLQSSYYRDVEQYKKDVNEYESKLTDEQKEALRKLKSIEKRDKIRRELKKQKEALKKPKQPLNPYLLFNAKRRAEEPPCKDLVEWSKKMKTEWAALPDDEKNKYVTKAKELAEQYKVELSLWEASLENTEHSHLLKTTKQPKKKSESTKSSEPKSKNTKSSEPKSKNTKSKPKSENRVSSAQKGNVPQNKPQNEK